MWGSMGGGGVSEGEEGGGASTTPPPPKEAQPPPTRPQETKVFFRVVRRKRRRGDPPAQKAETPPHHHHRTAYEGRPRPQTHQPPQDRHHKTPTHPPRPTPPRVPRRRTTVPRIRSSGRSSTYPHPSPLRGPEVARRHPYAAHHARSLPIVETSQESKAQGWVSGHNAVGGPRGTSWDPSASRQATRMGVAFVALTTTSIT